MLASVYPSLTPDQIEDYPLVRGWADIHAKRTQEGEALMWPDLRLSLTGRWLLSVREKLRRQRTAQKHDYRDRSRQHVDS